MSKSVTNDALWEKLSEIEEMISKSSKEQNAPVPIQEQADITPEIRAIKDEIIGKLEKYIQGLGTHCDSHFKAGYKHFEQLGEDIDGIYKVLTCISRIIQEPEKQSETKPEENKLHLNFILFKVRKTSLIMAALGLLTFILTIFCMKQQNDYALLNGKHYKQSIAVREMQVEIDSLRNTLINQKIKKK